MGRSRWCVCWSCRCWHTKDRRFIGTFESLNWSSLVISPFIVLITNSYSYVWRKRSANNGALFVPIGIPITCLNTLPPKRTKMLSIRKSIAWQRSLHEKWYLLHFFSSVQNVRKLSVAMKLFRLTAYVFSSSSWIRCFNFSCGMLV